MPITRRLGLLRDHDFRGLFVSTTVSQFGHQLTTLAIPLIAVAVLSAGEFQVGMLTAAASAAFLLVGLPAGAWVDRMRRRNVLIVADVARGALLLTVPVAWWCDVLTIWQLYVVVLVNGVFTVFFDVAYQSYLPHLVGRRHLMEGNSKLEAVRAVSQLSGPGLAGLLIQWLTAPVVLFLDAVALATSALAVARIRSREVVEPVAPGTRLRTQIGEGLRFVFGNRLLWSIALCTGIGNLFYTMYASMELVFLARELHQTPGTIGLIFSVSGAGGLLGAFVARRLTARFGQGPTMWLSMLPVGPAAALMPMAAPGWSLWLAALGGVVVSMGVVVYNITQVSFRQGLTPDRLLGRMNATMRFLVWGTMPLGGLIGGVLGEILGARGTMWVGVVGSGLAFLPIVLSPLRRMRELPTTGGDSDVLAENPKAAA
ncbi:putative MFS family arabinose efflux permease [Stackebrandtia albiflava]|uniref:Putative MFS family arabinose efflux permease n=1 Tax=Stackebrandtia albiflava TaxID=406432 RepID=A0A562UYH9_9ACTN|nr:MFS transporter [Stackebrandtia albiflava]TWJ10653.1 putative MFS family arabinose efflux permease [Stackebrandtia albiflava]